MRIAVVTTDRDTQTPPVGYGGLGRLAFGAALGFARCGAEVDLFAPRVREVPLPSGVRLRFHSGRPDDRTLSAADVVHITDPKSFVEAGLAPHAFPGTLFVCEQNAPYVAGPRGPNVRHVVFRADRLDTFGIGEAYLADQILLEDEIGPPLDPEPFILWMGRIHPDKAPDVLAQVAASMPETGFVVVGPAHAPEPGWSTNVVRIESVAGPKKAELIRRAAAFLYTVSANWVGAGELVLTEAAACGVPIVAQSFSGRCPASRLVIEGMTGFTARDAPGLASALNRARSLDRLRPWEILGARLQPVAVAKARLRWMSAELHGLREQHPLRTPNRRLPEPSDEGCPAPSPTSALSVVKGLLRGGDWHGAIAASVSALQGMKDNEPARAAIVVALGEALLRAGEEQVATGDVSAARGSFETGARMLWQEMAHASPSALPPLDACWIRLDCAARAQTAAEQLHALWYFLLEHDERVKALSLTRLAPWMVQDHPLVQEMEDWATKVDLHINDEAAYRAFYAIEHIKSPSMPHQNPAFLMDRTCDSISLASTLPPGARLLEVGCFDGPVLVPVARACPEIRITGVDYNVDALTRLETLLRKERLQVELRTALGEDDFDYDAILWTEVIEHVADPRSELEALRKRLKPGAPLFITTPWGSFELGRPPTLPTEPEAMAHVRAMTPRDLIDVCHKAGLQVSRLWRSPSGRSRGDGLHCIAVNRPPLSEFISFACSSPREAMVAVRPLAEEVDVEIFAPVREPFVESAIQVWPGVQLRHAQGPVVLIEVDDPRGDAILLRHPADKEPAPTLDILCVDPALAESLRERWGRTIHVVEDIFHGVEPVALVPLWLRWLRQRSSARPRRYTAASW